MAPGDKFRLALALVVCLRTAVSSLIRFCGINFPSARHEFLELAFDRSVPDVLILKHSVNVDRECVWNRRNGEAASNRALESGVAVLRPIHSILLYETLSTFARSHLGSR